MDEYFMNIAYKEAMKAYKKNEIPIGVVIVKNDVIVSKGYNLRDKKNIVTKHAEIIAIEKANIKLNNWRLIDCVLYTTLEPCNMCKEVIKESKIKKVIYGAKNNNTISENNYKQITSKELIDKCEKIIKEKFKELRDK